MARAGVRSARSRHRRVGPAFALAAALALAGCDSAPAPAVPDPGGDTAGDAEAPGEAAGESDDGASTATADAPDQGLADAQPAPAAATSVSGDLEVHYLDVGQADATLLLHDEVAVLIDAGHWQRSDVVPHLRARGVDALDLVIITHPHADHLGQFDQVLDAVDVAEVWWSGSVTTTRTFEQALSALERSDARYEEPRAGDTTRLGPLDVQVVNPPVGVNVDDLHDAGLSVRIGFGEVALLFTGDAEVPTEARMAADPDVEVAADILQVGHHASSTSTSPGFLAAVDPAVAIYSAGSGNQYGHPHASVLERLAAAGVTTYGTDTHGTVVVATEGSTWTVTTERDGQVAAPPPTDDTPAADDTSTGEATGANDGVDGGASECAAGQIDINTAGLDELQLIIHIGPARAEDLISLRPFTSVGALDRISGIGPARIDDIVEQGVACVG